MTAKDANDEDKTVSNTVSATKKKNGGKDKEEMAKIVLRRLPPGMYKDDLFSQLQPLEPEPRSFWFCPADTEMRPHAFSRAYLVFQEEKDAVHFAERFNGYVFVDKLGNESMAIVEWALNQSVPKSLLNDKTLTAKDCDTRCGTLKNEAQYLKFLDQYNLTLNTSTKRIIDFDSLVRQLEEKQRRQEEGQIQETPLTDYIKKLSQEKGRKKQNKLLERLEKVQVLTTTTSSFLTSQEKASDSTSDKLTKRNKSLNLKQKHEKKEKQIKEIIKINENIELKKKNKIIDTPNVNISKEIPSVSEIKQKKKSKERRETGVKNNNDQNEEKNVIKEKKLNDNQNIDNIKQTIDSKVETTSKQINVDEIKIENDQILDQNQKEKKVITPRLRGNKDRPEREIYRPHGGKSISSNKQPKTTVADKLKKQNQQINEKQN